jgi:hypothetical protein
MALCADTNTVDCSVKQTPHLDLALFFLVGPFPAYGDPAFPISRS